MSVKDDLIDVLSKARKENNISNEIKLEIDKILGCTKPGERVYHPVFGLGTLKSTSINYWAYVDFDDIESQGYWKSKKRRVGRHKLIGLTYLLNKEKPI